MNPVVDKKSLSRLKRILNPDQFYFLQQVVKLVESDQRIFDFVCEIQTGKSTVLKVIDELFENAAGKRFIEKN